METMKETDLTERQLDTENVYDGRLLHVYRDHVELPNGHKSTREYIRHGGAVAVVPVTEDGCVIVERQFRYPFGKVITEIPAGKLDAVTEDHLEAAQRELWEETGYKASEWIELGALYPSVAYTTETIWLYMAKGLVAGERNLDDDEFLNVHKVPMKDLVDAIMRGEISDAKTMSAILMAARKLGV